MAWQPTGADLKKWRLDAQLTQKEASDRIGCARRSVITWEGEAGKPLPTWVAKILAEQHTDSKHYITTETHDRPSLKEENSVMLNRRDTQRKLPSTLQDLLDHAALQDNQIDAALVIDAATGQLLYENKNKEKTGSLDYHDIVLLVTHVIRGYNLFRDGDYAQSLEDVNLVGFDLDMGTIYIKILPLVEQQDFAVFVNKNRTSFVPGIFSRSTLKCLEEIKARL
jgi:DNA-binding XRE family transcriptional regulator